MSLYEVLEVSERASPEIIRAAYKNLMQRHHPDKNPGNPAASIKTQQIVSAYEVLSDPAARKRYDELRSPKRSQSQKVEAASESVTPAPEQKIVPPTPGTIGKVVPIELTAGDYLRLAGALIAVVWVLYSCT
jgi:DnaJ-class molecular chaperone